MIRAHAAPAPALVLASLVLASACAGRQPKPVATPSAPSGTSSPPASGAAPTVRRASAEDEAPAVESHVCLASYYGKGFQGKLTASGTVFDKNEFVAAHPSWPFGTRVRVTNLGNGRRVVVEIVDRGPASQYVAEGVLIDLSRRAAEVLGFVEDGRQRVRLDVLEWGGGGSS